MAALERMSKGEVIPQLTILGVDLAHTNRRQARKIFKNSGLIVKSEKDNYWYDHYDSSKVIGGSSTLSVGYVLATNRLAVAEYAFPYTIEHYKF